MIGYTGDLNRFESSARILEGGSDKSELAAKGSQKYRGQEEIGRLKEIR